MRFSYDILDDREKIIYELRALYAGSGYSHFRMSRFEEYDFYSRNKDFLVSDSVITFTDANGKLMALKPDVTLSVIKNGADDPEGLRKVYYNENVYRIPKGAKAFREIMQAGLECIGRVDEGCLAEVLALALKSLEIFGEPFVLEVSSLDVLSAFIAKAACGRVSERELIEMAGSKNVHGISELLRGSGAGSEAGRPLLDLLGLSGTPGEVLGELKKLCAGTEAEGAAESLSRVLLSESCAGYGENIRVDFSLAGDMNYYNGMIFKGYLRPVPEYVLSGGQYDRLMRRLDRRSKAVGFAVYLDALERMRISFKG